MRPGPRLELVELRRQGADGRLGPGFLGGEGLLGDLQEGHCLLAGFQGFFEIGLRLFKTGAEFRRVQFGQELAVRDGLPLLDGNGKDTSAGLEGEMGLRGLDRSGVVELTLAGLPLSVVDEKPHADKEDNKDDDDPLFQGDYPLGT